MKLNPYEFQVLVKDKPMLEMVDPRDAKIYLVAEAGVEYKLKFLNHSEEPVHVAYSIDGKPSYWRYSCFKSIIIEGQRDGNALRSFIFASTPISTSPPAPSETPHPPGTIYFEVFNSVLVAPFEVNTHPEVPETHKFDPHPPHTQKIAALGTALGAPHVDILDRKTVTLGCGNDKLASISFFIRSPREMCAAKLMLPCWENWWQNERNQYGLGESKWEIPSFSCGAGAFSLNDLDLESPATNSHTSWKKWGLQLRPEPKSLLQIFLTNAVPTHRNVERYLNYFRTKILTHISLNNYESWYDPNDKTSPESYASWVEAKSLDNQPKIILQAFSDAFGIPLHIYSAVAGTEAFKIFEVLPEKGRKLWADGIALVYDNKKWFSVRRCEIDLTNAEEDEARDRLQKEMENLQKELDQKRKLVAEMDNRKKIKTERAT